jgi:hypothetical protein
MTAPKQMNAGLVEIAVRRHVNTRANLLVPEAAVRYQRGTYTDWKGIVHPHFDDYRADFMMVTASGMATEIEVKVSRADWRVDLAKPKWQGMPAWVTRFVYAVPEDLGIPDFVPAHAGVWHIVPDVRRIYSPTEEPRMAPDGYRVVLARAPKKLGKEKVPAEVVSRWMKNFYYRYWDMRQHADQRIPQRIRETV